MESKLELSKTVRGINIVYLKNYKVGYIENGHFGGLATCAKLNPSELRQIADFCEQQTQEEKA
jgi:hypothetical protein